MRKLLVMLLTLGLILIGTYCQSAEQGSGGETKIKMEKKTEKKAPSGAQEESQGTEEGEEAESPSDEEAD